MPFLSDSELDALLEQLPALAGRPRRLEELSGGLTNRNVKITTPTGAYVARCSVNAQNLLGIDRDNEFYNSRAAAEAGVGAPVIDYRPDLGILLVGFLEGVTLTNADLQRPGVLARVATGVRPGGFSSIRETSRSPKTVSSRVRGMGVADMASKCVA